MKALLIGGTGTISTAITKRLAGEKQWELYLLNRGNRNEEVPENVKILKGDMTKEAEIANLLEGMEFDCVCEFIGFKPEQVERDIRLFQGKTKQYIYISSAAAYHTPPARPILSEGMLLSNPYWEYARDKIACEQLLLDALRTSQFPVTIVRPCHTYGERFIPFCLESPKGSWPVIQRMLDGKQIIVPGDGSSLWVMTFNEDFAKAFVGLMGNIHAIGEAVHVTSDEVLTWNQMAQTVADLLHVEYRPYYIPTDVLTAIEPELDGGLNGDKRHSIMYDTTKIKQLSPGYCPSISWKMGVERCLKRILSDPSLRPQDPEFDAWCDKLIEIYDKALEDAKNICGRLY